MTPVAMTPFDQDLFEKSVKKRVVDVSTVSLFTALLVKNVVKGCISHAFSGLKLTSIELQPVPGL